MEKDEGTSDQPHKLQNSRPVRERVLTAAFGLFCDRGFAAATMLDIATRAHISKRDLYALFENKYALVAQCVEERAQAMHRSLDPAITVPKSQNALTLMLAGPGTAVLQTVCQAEVLMVQRLAITQSDRAPEIAHVLNRNGRGANHRALADLLTKAQAFGLVGASDPGALAARFFVLLWDDLLVRLLMPICEAAALDEIIARAKSAAAAVMEPARFKMGWDDRNWPWAEGNQKSASQPRQR